METAQTLAEMLYEVDHSDHVHLYTSILYLLIYDESRKRYQRRW